MAQFLNFKGDYNGLSEKKASDNLNMYGNNIFTETEDKSFKSYHYLLDPTAVLLLISGLLQDIYLVAVCHRHNVHNNGDSTDSYALCDMSEK